MTLGYSEISEKILSEYSEKLHRIFTHGFTFLSFTWESTIFLPYFERKFLLNGGEIIKRHITSFQELKDYDLVVNCTGLGSRTLAGKFTSIIGNNHFFHNTFNHVGDLLVHPMRGQVIRIMAPWIYHIILCDTDETCYIIPNTHSVILGGTKQESYNLRVDGTDKKNILR